MAVRRSKMKIARELLSLFAGMMALTGAASPTMAETSIKIGRTVIPNVSHLPLYVAMETGLFHREGLKAIFVAMPERALVTAGLGGKIDFVPLPRAGVKAAIRGAAVRFVVGQSLFPPMALMAQPQITGVADLKHQQLGFGQMGQSSYHDGETILRRIFGLILVRDYRATSIPDERQRLAALENGDIQAGLFSLINAAKAEARGFKRVFGTGAFLPRVEGAIWTRAQHLQTNRDTVRRFIRAVAKAADLIHTDGKRTVPVIQKYLQLREWEETRALWHSVRDTYTADIPPPMLRNLFAEQRRRLLQKGAWSSKSKMPNPEYYIARGLLTETLNQVTRTVHSFTIRTGTP